MSYEIEFPAPVIYTTDKDVYELAKQYSYGKSGMAENSVALLVYPVYHHLCQDFVNYADWQTRTYRPEECAGFRLTAMLKDLINRPWHNNGSVILEYVPSLY